ncbi:class I SAM-dependent methyltransferase [Pseudoblastomonas halimionae]|uniref:class I SAM-dependent methyltransferase n=1 Tax=Alteriqipengyuania halimionae TaxID=1926630 RepID=UPI002D7FC387|nr:SAM-dependent methyltransferase [Alteriqipengyuania halimionae]
MSDYGDSLRRLIRNTGPIPVAQFMAESNAHYYATRDPLGRGGDFVTAPEVSQMFGEMLGLWLADRWKKAGAPDNAIYVEFGPGRGTLASDALRAMAAAGLDPDVHFVEGSPVLRAAQAEAVPQARFHDDLTTLPDDRPLLVIANEYFDALPVRQLVKTEAGWRERMVGLEGERLVPVASDRPMDAALPSERRDAEPGTIIETAPAQVAQMRELGTRLATQGGAAMVVDYGYARPHTGSTLQALRAHEKVDPFAHPGEADLTAHVDFLALADTAIAAQAQVLGIATQSDLLRALGIERRAEALIAAAPARTEEIASALDRLVSPEQMGTLFKALLLAGEGWSD